LALFSLLFNCPGRCFYYLVLVFVCSNFRTYGFIWLYLCIKLQCSVLLVSLSGPTALSFACFKLFYWTNKDWLIELFWELKYSSRWLRLLQWMHPFQDDTSPTANDRRACVVKSSCDIRLVVNFIRLDQLVQSTDWTTWFPLAVAAIGTSATNASRQAMNHSLAFYWRAITMLYSASMA